MSAQIADVMKKGKHYVIAVEDDKQKICIVDYKNTGCRMENMHWSDYVKQKSIIKLF